MEKALKQKPNNLVKVVLFGPESTGKTTMAQELARYYNTIWVPEFARDYLQDKWDRTQKSCEVHDLLPIARGQISLENKLAENANRLLFCDTDLLETMVYSEVYYNGYCPPEIEEYALQNQYDLYLLTYIDIPWQADDLRDKPLEREEMFQYFKGALEKYNRNFITLKGSKDDRLKYAVSHINQYL